MISFIRRLFTSKVGGILALLLLALIAVGFATGDIQNATKGGAVAGGNIAKVGNRQIGIGELRTAIRNAHAQAQQNQPGLSMEQFIGSGAADKILDQLIEGYALEQYATKLGFAVGKAQVDARIAAMPQFKGLTGNFDQSRFEEWLVQSKISDRQLRESLTRSLLIDQLLRPIGRIGSVPKSLATPYAELLLEARTGSATFLPSAQYAPTADPDDATLATYFKTNARTYQIAEQRALRFAEFDVKSLAKPEPVTDAEIAEFFKTNADKFAATQKRVFAQVIVPDAAAAQKLADSARRGGMAQAVSAAGLATTTITAAKEADLAQGTTTDIAKAGFAAKAGDVIGPLKAELGFVVLKLETISGAPARTLAQASDEIRVVVADRKQQEAALDAFNRISDAVNKGASVAEVAKTNALTVETTPLLTAAATAPEQPSYRVGPSVGRILPSAFQLSGENLSEIVELAANQRYAVAEVAKIAPAAPPPIADVRARVIADWKQAEGAKKARTLARAIADTVSKSGDLAAASRAAGVGSAPVQRISGIRKDFALAAQKGRVPPELALLFTMDMRAAKTYELPGNTGWMVIFLDSITPGNVGSDANGNAALTNAVMRQMGPAIGNELVGQLLEKSKRDLGSVINSAAFTALKDELSGKARATP